MPHPARALIAVTLTAAAIAPVAAQQAAPPLPTRASLSAQLDQRFALIDGNKDGSFTKAEFTAAQKLAQQRISTRIMKMLSAEFTSIDGDKNQSITSAEFAARKSGGQSKIDPTALFKAMDANSDGKVTQMEYTVPATRVVATVDADTQMKKFDSSGDGKVTLVEFKAPALASFDAADGNKDGTISLDEQKKAVAARGR